MSGNRETMAIAVSQSVSPQTLSRALNAIWDAEDMVVEELTRGMAENGGSLTRATFEKVVRSSFRGGAISASRAIKEARE